MKCLIVYINASNLKKEKFFTIQQELLEHHVNSSSKQSLKLIQNVATRWSSTCHMLIEEQKLRWTLNEYHSQHEAVYLQLTEQKWSQIEYLIELIKSFCVFIKMIEQIRESTIHYVFEIYDKLFDHLNEARSRLFRKRSAWKLLLRDELTAANLKLRTYYEKTQSSLELLYEKAVLLISDKKNKMFLTSNLFIYLFILTSLWHRSKVGSCERTTRAMYEKNL